LALAGLLAVLVALLLASIPGHPIHVDEPWLAEQSYFLARDGYVHSNFFRGVDGGEQYIVLYHRLFILLQSRLFAVFGLSVLTARLASILPGAILLGLVAWYARRDLGLGVAGALGAVAVLLLMPFFTWSFAIARPEMLVAALGFASFMAVERATRPPAAMGWAALAGVLAGGAMLSHLNGSVFIAAGVGALAIRRCVLEALALALCAGLALVPYGVDIVRHRALFELQLHGRMLGGVTTFTMATPLLNLLHEHQRLFRMPEIIFPSVLFFLCVLLGWRRASPALRFTAGYTLLLMVALGALASRKMVHYAAGLAPLWALVIVAVLAQVPQMERRAQRVLQAAAAAMLVSGMWFAVMALKGKTRFEAFHAAVTRDIPDGARCLTPMRLLFNQVERLDLVATTALRATAGPAYRAAEVRGFIASRQVEYVIVLDDDPKPDLLQALGPMAPVSEGSFEGHPYRVYRPQPGGAP
jgi:hypothetical protein